MERPVGIAAILISLFLSTSLNAWSQGEFKTEDPVEYNNYIVQEQERIGREFIDFSNLMLGGGDYREIENKRLEVIKQLELSLRRLRNMAPFKGGSQFKNEAVAVFDLYKTLHANEYGKIAVLVTSKENSIGDLEEYYSMQMKAEKKMQEYADRMRLAQDKFAGQYRLTIVHNPMQDQFERILLANIYSREVFLAYLAVAKQNEAWWDAMQAGKTDEMEKTRMAVLEACKLSQIHKMEGFKGDMVLRDAAKARIDYYQKLAGKDYKEIADILKNPKRTKEDVDLVNTVIDDYNDRNMAMNEAFNEAHRQLKLNALPAPSGGSGGK